MARSRTKNTREPLIALHRYWLNANLLKIYFEQSGRESLEELRALKDDPLGAISFFLSAPATFMGYWYAALYVVIEGYRELRLSDPEIDQLLGSGHVDALRLFRNGMFHYQKAWYSQKLGQIVEATEHVEWIRSLHSKVGRFLLERIKELVSQERWAEIEKTIEEMRKLYPHSK